MEKVHKLRGEKKERDKSPDGAPVYFHLLRGGTRGRGLSERIFSTLTFSDLPPFFRIIEDFPVIVQVAKISENHCINLIYREWERVQAKLKADIKEYPQMNANFVAFLIEITQKIETEITERVTRFIKKI